MKMGIIKMIAATATFGRYAVPKSTATDVCCTILSFICSAVRLDGFDPSGLLLFGNATLE
ncbi:hypothetical protein QQP08_022208 [Theobroma cacao]|nr:hypothetical protein QQP08_022208 [Theobroma cacao]